MGTVWFSRIAGMGVEPIMTGIWAQCDLCIRFTLPHKPIIGFEPTTLCLRRICTTVVLYRHKMEGIVHVLLLRPTFDARRKPSCIPYKTTCPDVWCRITFTSGNIPESPTTATHGRGLISLEKFFRKVHQQVYVALLYGKMDPLGLEPKTDRLWAGCSNQLS